MEEGDKGCPMIRMGVSGWMFLLVTAHIYPGSPEQKAVKRLCVCVCVCVCVSVCVAPYVVNKLCAFYRGPRCIHCFLFVTMLQNPPDVRKYLTNYFCALGRNPLGLSAIANALEIFRCTHVCLSVSVPHKPDVLTPNFTNWIFDACCVSRPSSGNVVTCNILRSCGYVDTSCLPI